MIKQSQRDKGMTPLEALEQLSEWEWTTYLCMEGDREWWTIKEMLRSLRTDPNMVGENGRPIGPATVEANFERLTELGICEEGRTKKKVRETPRYRLNQEFVKRPYPPEYDNTTASYRTTCSFMDRVTPF